MLSFDYHGPTFQLSEYLSRVPLDERDRHQGIAGEELCPGEDDQNQSQRKHHTANELGQADRETSGVDYQSEELRSKTNEDPAQNSKHKQTKEVEARLLLADLGDPLRNLGWR